MEYSQWISVIFPCYVHFRVRSFVLVRLNHQPTYCVVATGTVCALHFPPFVLGHRFISSERKSRYNLLFCVWNVATNFPGLYLVVRGAFLVCWLCCCRIFSSLHYIARPERKCCNMYLLCISVDRIPCEWDLFIGLCVCMESSGVEPAVDKHWNKLTDKPKKKNSPIAKQPEGQATQNRDEHELRVAQLKETTCIQWK